MKIKQLSQIWQTESKNLTSSHIQFWAGGGMATAQLPLTEARLLVDAKHAFVISETAIGLLTDGYLNS